MKTTTNNEAHALDTKNVAATVPLTAAKAIIIEEDTTLSDDDCVPLTESVDLGSPEYAQTVIGMCLRKAYRTILSEEGLDGLTAGQIQDGLKRHTVLGCEPTLGSGIPVINTEQVTAVLAAWKIPQVESAHGPAWDLQFINATAREKAEAQVFIWGVGSAGMKTA